MGLNESRLRAMLDPHSLADWNLNAEDRAAIEWAFARMESLELELRTLRVERIEELNRAIQRRDAAREAIRRLGDLL
jgi:hypothetical protein